MGKFCMITQSIKSNRQYDIAYSRQKHKECNISVYICKNKQEQTFVTDERWYVGCAKKLFIILYLLFSRHYSPECVCVCLSDIVRV